MPKIEGSVQFLLEEEQSPKLKRIEGGLKKLGKRPVILRAVREAQRFLSSGEGGDNTAW